MRSLSVRPDLRPRHDCFPQISSTEMVGLWRRTLIEPETGCMAIAHMFGAEELECPQVGWTHEDCAILRDSECDLRRVGRTVTQGYREIRKVTRGYYRNTLFKDDHLSGITQLTDPLEVATIVDDRRRPPDHDLRNERSQGCMDTAKEARCGDKNTPCTFMTIRQHAYPDFWTSLATSGACYARNDGDVVLSRQR